MADIVLLVTVPAKFMTALEKYANAHHGGRTATAVLTESLEGACKDMIRRSQHPDEDKFDVIVEEP